MPHDTALVATIAAGLGLAFVFGFIAAHLRLPPLVGYLLAGVAVGPFSPGFVADTGFFRDTMTPQRRATLVGQTATGRAGTPADVAALVRWLAAPEAGHVTAQIVQVNGGAERGR